MKTVDTQEIRVRRIDVPMAKQALSLAIYQAEISYTLFELISKLIADKFEGKRVNRRIETELKKILPECTVMFSDVVGSHFNIVIWGAGICYDHRLSFILCYQRTNPFFLQSFFIEQNQNHALDAGRIAMYVKAFSFLNNIADNWNKAVDALCEMKEEIDSWQCGYLLFDPFDFVRKAQSAVDISKQQERMHL